MKFLRPILIAAACLTTGVAVAHDAWIEPLDGAFQVVFGHGGKLEVAAAGKIKAVAAFDAKGSRLPLGVATGDSPRLTVRGQPAVLTLHYDNGVWTKTVEGSKNLPKNEVPGALSANHVVKFGKTVLIWGSASASALGQRLEIVPLATQAPKTGASLPLLVLWEGKPLAAAKLKINDSMYDGHEIVTDAEGKALAPVTKGRNALQTSYKVDLAGDPRADTYSASANLVFDLR